MDGYDSHGSYFRLFYHLERSSWGGCQPYHFPPISIETLIADADDDSGGLDCLSDCLEVREADEVPILFFDSRVVSLELTGGSLSTKTQKLRRMFQESLLFGSGRI